MYDGAYHHTTLGRFSRGRYLHCWNNSVGAEKIGVGNVSPREGAFPTKVILDGLKRNIARGNSLSDELDLSSVLGDTRAYLYSPVLG